MAEAAPGRILTLGMGRSGTTFITEFLGRCGVFLDKVNWAYEHEGARAINDTILEKEYGARRGLPYGVLPDGEIEVGDKWHRRARDFIAKMDKQALKARARWWTFKDPRTTVLHTLWSPHFQAFVGTFRRPEQVVASYATQDWVAGPDRDRVVLGYWKRFNRSLVRLHDADGGARPFCLVDYNRDIEAQTLRMCERLGLAAPEAARGLFAQEKNRHRDVPLVSDPEAEDLHRQLVALSLAG